jgi:antitoxin (DNA-binding transcriptional repressor) of toxin-antitoxin stability system
MCTFVNMPTTPENEREIGVRDLRKQLATTLYDVVVHRDEFYITNHGRRVAKLVPLPLEQMALTRKKDDA